MTPDVSVIVPVYKVEPYLRQCLDSLIGQTKHEIEIILIDDGSPDRCGQICEEYARKDSRIKVLHQENQGLAQTRNNGLDVSTANYIMFVDSDDYIAPSFCERAHQLITKHNADLVFFEYSPFKKTRRLKSPFPAIKEGYKTIPEAIELLFGVSGNYAWNKIYSKSLFEGIRYPKGRLFEDIGTTYQLVLKAHRIWYAPEILYYYRIREGSIVHTKSVRNRNDFYEMTKRAITDLQNIKSTQKIADNLIIKTHFSYVIAYPKNVSDPRWTAADKALIALKPTVPACLTPNQKIMLLLFWHCRPLFNTLCIIFRRRVKLQ